MEKDKMDRKTKISASLRIHLATVGKAFRLVVIFFYALLSSQFLQANCSYTTADDLTGYTKVKINGVSSNSQWMNMSPSELANNKYLTSSPLLIDYIDGTSIQVDSLCERLTSNGFADIKFLETTQENEKWENLDAYSLLVLLGDLHDVTLVTNDEVVKLFITSLRINHKKLSVISSKQFLALEPNSVPERLLVFDEKILADDAVKAEIQKENIRKILVAPSLAKVQQELAIQRIVDAKRKSPLDKYRCEM